MLTRRMTHATVCVTAALLGSILVAGTAHAQALVKVTPIGSHSGELCARDLLAEGLHLAAQSRAAHPAHPHPHHDPAAVNGHVRRRPLVIAVHPGGLRAAPRAGHRPVPGPRPHDDHLARVFDALDDQCRQP